MKSILVLACALSLALASQNPTYRVNDDAPVAAEPLAAQEGDDTSVSLSIVTLDAKGRVLQEEPITEDELKQLEAQLAKQQTAKPVNPQGRRPQFSLQSLASRQQPFSAYPEQAYSRYAQEALPRYPQQGFYREQPSFGYQQQPNYSGYLRQAYQNPFYKAAPVFMSQPQQPFYQGSQNQQPFYQSNQQFTSFNPFSQYRGRPVYFVDNAAFQEPQYYDGGYQRYQRENSPVPHPQQNQNARNLGICVYDSTTGKTVCV